MDEEGPVLSIDCDCCRMEGTTACDDCVVSFLLHEQASTVVRLSPREAGNLAVLQRAGLAPELRHVAVGRGRL